MAKRRKPDPIDDEATRIMPGHQEKLMQLPDVEAESHDTVIDAKAVTAPIDKKPGRVITRELPHLQELRRKAKKQERENRRQELPPWLGDLLDRIPVVWAGIGGGVVILVLLLTVALGGGVSESGLVAFFDHLENGRLTEAEQSVAELGGSGELQEKLQSMLALARRAELRTLRKRANRNFAKKDYTDAIDVAERAIKLDPNADMHFMLAQARRLSGQDPIADYGTFIENYPDDSRLDDALFWRAESLLAGGQRAEALEDFRRVVEIRGSNFRTSAGRRVAELE